MQAYRENVSDLDTQIRTLILEYLYVQLINLKILRKHNEYRKRHGAPPLKYWDRLDKCVENRNIIFFCNKMYSGSHFPFLLSKKYMIYSSDKRRTGPII
jgi:hypothetical protein